METVLYESPDISRNDLTDIYGPPTYVRQFIDILKERYSDKKLTTNG